MKHFLESLRVSALSNLEAGQLVNRHLADLGTIDQALMTDGPFNNYMSKLSDHSDLFEKAMAQIRASEITLNIANADTKRDKSNQACRRCLALYALSDDPEEVAASRSLNLIFKNFRNLPNLNYEAETIAIDKLISDLEEPTAAAHVSTLNMERYITRLKADNEAFKVLFGQRIQTEAQTEDYDMKIIRRETFQTYRDFCNYVLAMAKAQGTPLFEEALDLINAGRNYYANMLARRNPKEEALSPN
ncbi:DUF6261 family protein [Sunxiuqinia rutila]|uniref:DUF6261 family protein n=1 Tax=Sunxiuqinia rutila TaxID=1397841 RepID=UPI003D361E07